MKIQKMSKDDLIKNIEKAENLLNNKRWIKQQTKELLTNFNFLFSFSDIIKALIANSTVNDATVYIGIY